MKVEVVTPHAGGYARAVGIDISAGAMISRGGSIESWEFLKRDLNEGSLPFPDGCADGVRANQVVEHVANPLHFVAEACRVLRPGEVYRRLHLVCGDVPPVEFEAAYHRGLQEASSAA